MGLRTKKAKQKNGKAKAENEEKAKSGLKRMGSMFINMYSMGGKKANKKKQKYHEESDFMF